MNPEQTTKHTQFEKNVFPIIYIAGLLVAFHAYFIVYINSTFLANYIDEKYVGILYIAGALLTILTFTKIPHILKKVGNYKLISFAIVLEFIMLMIMGFSNNALFIVPAFIIHNAINPLFVFCLDLFLEDYSRNEDTGSVRGIFLTILSLPAIIATFTLSFILADNEYWKVYLMSALSLIPLFIILFQSFRKFRDPSYRPYNPVQTLKTRFKDKNIYDIFIDNFLLHIFYSFIVIYMPIYLYKHIGFSLSEVGLMYSISLLPFIIFQIPVGRIADKRLGEKEFLILGFVVLSLAVVIISLLDSKSFFMWALLIFIARSGAAIIEVTSETYFFKHVDKTDSGLISLFRMVSPTANVFTTVLATILLLFIPLNYIFFIFGILIVVVGLRYTIPLQDTL